MLTTLHVQRLLQWQKGAMDSWGSTWAKIVNPPESSASPWPNQKVNVRWWTDDIDAAYAYAGYQGGVEFVRRMAPTWAARAYAAAYSLGNELDVNDLVRLEALIGYWRGAMDEANRRGIKLVILESSEASPHGGDPYSEATRVDKCKRMVPAIRQAVEQGHYVGMHAYWRPGVEGPTGTFHALGHVAFTAKVWGDNGVDLDRLQLLVTETGIDGGIAGHTMRQGWRDLTTLDAYAGEIAQGELYARGLRYIKAMMLFTAGYESPWSQFNLTESDCGVIGARLASVAAPLVPDESLEEQIVVAAQRHIIPRTPGWALYEAGKARGYMEASPEFDMGEWRCQAFRQPGVERWQYIGYCRVGDWGNVSWVTVDNQTHEIMG